MPTVAEVLKLADAVTTELNAPASPTVWDQTFTAKRKRYVLTKPTDLGPTDYKVTVVPGSDLSEVLTREGDDRTFMVGVYVQHNEDPNAATPDDTSINLIEQIANYWRLRTPSAFRGVVCIKSEKPVLYKQDDLHESQIATIPLYLTFRIGEVK